MVEDLWASLEAASGKPVLAVMSTWTKQMGFPVISVEGRQVGGCGLGHLMSTVTDIYWIACIIIFFFLDLTR